LEQICFLTHTLWNSRIGWIGPLIPWGLGGRFFEPFCNIRDLLTEHPMDRGAADPVALRQLAEALAVLPVAEDGGSIQDHGFAPDMPSFELGPPHADSRRVLAWKLWITMDTSFCIEALEEALSRNERPEIFNTDQGSQFTSEAFTGRLKEEGIAISMDGKGRWCDNVFVERFWKSIKYEHVYLHAYESVQEARTKIGRYIDFYNKTRAHSSLKALTPDQVYFNRPPEALAA